MRGRTPLSGSLRAAGAVFLDHEPHEPHGRAAARLRSACPVRVVRVVRGRYSRRWRAA